MVLQAKRYSKVISVDLRAHMLLAYRRACPANLMQDNLASSHGLLRAEHYDDELEPLLETIILEDFNVQTEDGSPREVCDRRYV